MSCIMTNIALVPFCPVLLHPCAMPPKSCQRQFAIFLQLLGHAAIFCGLRLWDPWQGAPLHLHCIVFKMNSDSLVFHECMRGKTVLNEAYLQNVRTFMAYCVTMCCCVSLGRAVHVAFAPRLGCVPVGCLELSDTIRGMGSIMCWAGITPGVLFQVTRQWSWGVIFNTHLTVGFCDFMIGLALVMQGIVMMGVSSITLCSSSCASRCLTLSTLCSSEIGGGVSRLSIQVPRSLSKCLPWEWYLLHQCAWSIHQWGHTGIDWELTQVIDNVAEIFPSSQKYGKPLYLGCNNGHIGNDLLKG